MLRRLAVSLVFVLAASSSAFARSEKLLAYPRDQAWPTAVRFVRVDAHLKIIEKDGDAGYILFELREDKKTFRGSLEVIDVVKDGRHLVRFVVTIEDRPAWVEVQMLEQLERKLRTELGTPAPAPTPAPPPTKDEPKPAPPKDEPKPDEGPRVSPTP
jgi:hypothetical protein